jgi:hypothetical protein
MPNSIRSVSFGDRLVDPTLAWVTVCVGLRDWTPEAQIRGRLEGPRCLYADTVEVAYPFRELARPVEPADAPCILVRAVIPEPNLWEPQCPFLYEGSLELWERDELVEQVPLSRGLRSITLGPPRIRLNGRPFSVKGIAQQQLGNADAKSLRDAGFNTLVAPVAEANAALWSAAARFGFLMLGWVNDPLPSGDLLSVLREHTATLAFVAASDGSLPLPRVDCAGVELLEDLAGPIPSSCAFVVCSPGLLPALAMLPIPKLIRTFEKPSDTPEWQVLLSSPGVLGYIWDPGINTNTNNKERKP